MQRLAWYGALASLAAAVAMWGFTVDDALIPLRYAQHLGAGVGYRFNAHGPATDGVTPLPWAFLLVPFARGDLMLGLTKVKALGVALTTLTGGALGQALARRGRPAFALIAMTLVAVAFPVAAWAVSGMETGLATALTTFGAIAFAHPRRCAVLAGLAATLRPELAPWAVVLAVGAAIAGAAPIAAALDDAATPAARVSSSRSPAAMASLLALALSLGPFVACAILRQVVFGRPMPLAVLAKPSDLAHGIAYAGAAVVVVLLPLAALPSTALARVSLSAKTIALAAVVHVVVVALVGGDWMPYARLVVPVAPSLALVFVEVAERAPRASLFRATLVATLGGWLAFKAAPAGRHVHADRQELVLRARPELVGAKAVAALDVGWVGAATTAEVFDLAGLTDPSVAVLPGGHTSKAVDASMLLERDVDTVVVYLSRPRWVEERLLRSSLFVERYELAVTVGQGPLRYAVYRRRPA